MRHIRIPRRTAEAAAHTQSRADRQLLFASAKHNGAFFVVVGTVLCFLRLVLLIFGAVAPALWREKGVNDVYTSVRNVFRAGPAFSTGRFALAWGGETHIFLTTHLLGGQPPQRHFFLRVLRSWLG